MITLSQLTSDDLKYLSEFERITGIYPSTFIESDGCFVFLVDNKGELYKCLGKNRSTLSKIVKIFRNPVFVYIGNQDMEKQLKNIFYNLSKFKVKIQEKNPGKQVTLIVKESERGYAVGKGGIKIKGIKKLLLDRFQVTYFQLRTTKEFREETTSQNRV